MRRANPGSAAAMPLGQHGLADKPASALLGGPHEEMVNSGANIDTNLRHCLLKVHLLDILLLDLASSRREHHEKPTGLDNPLD